MTEHDQNPAREVRPSPPAGCDGILLRCCQPNPPGGRIARLAAPPDQFRLKTSAPRPVILSIAVINSSSSSSLWRRRLVLGDHGSVTPGGNGARGSVSDRRPQPA